MIEIREAWPEDRDLILPVLAQFKNSYVGEAGWSRLFSDPWKTGENCGMVMTDDGRAVGYLGLLFSRPVIGGEVRSVANLTSWIVEEPYRKHSLGLLLPVLKLPHTLTDYTPSADVHRLLLRTQFRELETGYRYLFPSPIHARRCRILSDPAEFLPFLDPADLKRYEDHRDFGLVHLFIRAPDGDCYIVLSKLIRKKPPYRLGEVHFTSRPDVFGSHTVELVSRICRLMCVFTLFCDERYLGGRKVPGSIQLRLDPPRLYRSDSMKPEEITGLYSELAVLGL